MNVVRFNLLAPMIAAVCLVAGPASATWQLYASGEFGYSIDKGKVSGSADALGNGIDEFFSGKDNDVSPMLGGSFGVEIPMFELTPWRMPYDIRLPDWPVRIEIEISGLRDYELKTDGFFAGGGTSDSFNTDVKLWTFMTNVWLDMPLKGLYRPISATSGFLFGQPRLPWFRRFLQPATMYAGLGIGFSHLDVDASEPNFEGSDKKYDFAYQFGTGFGYQLTDYVNLGVGYRYIKPSKIKMKLSDDADRPGKLQVSNDIHEIRFSVRIRVFDLPYPWR